MELCQLADAAGAREAVAQRVRQEVVAQRAVPAQQVELRALLELAKGLRLVQRLLVQLVGELLELAEGLRLVQRLLVQLVGELLELAEGLQLVQRLLMQLVGERRLVLRVLQRRSRQRGDAELCG